MSLVNVVLGTEAGVNVMVLDEAKFSAKIKKECDVDGVVTRTFGFIETPKGVVRICTEGVHADPIASGKTFEFLIFESNLHCNPKTAINATFEDIADCMQDEPIQLHKFVRRFGARLESNFMTALHTLKEAGVNPKLLKEESRRR